MSFIHISEVLPVDLPFGCRGIFLLCQLVPDIFISHFLQVVWWIWSQLLSLS